MENHDTTSPCEQLVHQDIIELVARPELDLRLSETLAAFHDLALQAICDTACRACILDIDNVSAVNARSVTALNRLQYAADQTGTRLLIDVQRYDHPIWPYLRITRSARFFEIPTPEANKLHNFNA